MTPSVIATRLLQDQLVSQMSQSLVELELGEYYEVLKELGSGTFGLVLKAQNRVTGDTMALKCLRKSHTSMKCFLEECTMAFFLSAHPCVIGCYGLAFQTVEHYVFAQELCPAGDLFSLIEDHQFGVPELKVKRCADQISRGLNFLHHNGLVHRDVKPENVLLIDTDCLSVKVTDFGMTRLKGTTVHARTGTVPFMAPELFQPSPLEADPALDVWAFGVLLFAAITGTLPWEEAVIEDNGYQAFVEWMNTGAGPIPAQWERFTPEALTMLGRFLQQNASQRGRIIETLNFLDVPWTVHVYPTDGMDQVDLLKDTEPVSSKSMCSRSDGRQSAINSGFSSSSFLCYPDSASKEDEATGICTSPNSMPTSTSICTYSSSEPVSPEPRTFLTDQWGEESTGQCPMVNSSSLFIGAEAEVS